MEAAALLSMYHYLFDRYRVVLEYIVTDDDSTMRSHLCWKNDDYKKKYGSIPQVPHTRGRRIGALHDRPNHGKLRFPIPEPRFLADPAHRKKTFKNRLCALCLHKRHKVEAQDGQFHEVDILRLTRNFKHMAGQLKDTPKEKWPTAGRAVLDHLFDIHDGFCKRKKELAQNFDNPKKVHRSMTKDRFTCDKVLEVLEDFITMEKLEEIAHGFSTNPNESFNNSAAWIAPKNKVCSGSISLKARLCIALGIKLRGFEEFFTKVYTSLGIQIENGTWHYLQVTANWKAKHLARSQTREYKLKREAKTHEKIRMYVEQLRQSRRDNLFYESGIAMDPEQQAIYTPINRKETTAEQEKPKKRCKCGSTSHQRTNNSDCPLNKRNDGWEIALQRVVEMEREEQQKQPAITKEHIPAVEQAQVIETEEQETNPPVYNPTTSDGDEQDMLDEFDLHEDCEQTTMACQSLLALEEEEDDDEEEDNKSNQDTQTELISTLLC